MIANKKIRNIASTIVIILLIISLSSIIVTATLQTDCENIGGGTYISGRCLVKDANDCPITVNSVTCSGGKVACGIVSDLPVCETPSSLTLPGTWSSGDQVTWWSGNPGYVLDCYATGGSPQCMPWRCQRNSTCDTWHRYTECNTDDSKNKR